MTGYERCEKHQVTRCVACTPRSVVVSTEGVGFHGPVGPFVDVEQMLDESVSNDGVGAQIPPKLDQQQIEAIERQKEIAAARDPLLAPATQAYIFSEDPPFQLSLKEAVVSNVVLAAQKYAQAEIEVKAAELRGRKAREERDLAVEVYKEAIITRDRLKQELQDLVAN